MKDDFVIIAFVFCFLGRIIFVWGRFISPIIDDLEVRRDSLFKKKEISF
jgi:hypothetical protein